MSTTEEHFPTSAIVLAVVFSLFCLLGLLFLVLMKQVRQVGFVQVAVQGNGFCYVTNIPVTHPQDVLAIHDEVEYARELVGQSDLIQGDLQPFATASLPQRCMPGSPHQR